MSWRKCSTCKGDIAYGAQYFVCSVSTCNKKRTGGMVFCKEPCWDAHVPIMNHRDAWWSQKTAPKDASAAADVAATGLGRSAGKKEVVPTEIKDSGGAKREILVVGTRFKGYVADRSGMNASEQALKPLSDIVRAACDEAIVRAANDGRKTIKDRDFRHIEKSTDSREVMVIVSRLKAYVLAKSGLKTSETCLAPLSDIVRKAIREGIRAAAMDDRKTVLDRDVPKTLEALS